PFRHYPLRGRRDPAAGLPGHPRPPHPGGHRGRALGADHAHSRPPPPLPEAPGLRPVGLPRLALRLGDRPPHLPDALRPGPAGVRAPGPGAPLGPGLLETGARRVTRTGSLGQEVAWRPFSGEGKGRPGGAGKGDPWTLDTGPRGVILGREERQLFHSGLPCRFRWRGADGKVDRTWLSLSRSRIYTSQWKGTRF